MTMKQLDKNVLLHIIVPIILALIFAFGVSKIASSPNTYKHTIASLDEKKDTVMGLSAAAATTSAAITLLPGDTMTPISDKMADLTTCLMAVVSVIYLEKYLLTVLGYLICAILIPITCLLFGLNHFKNVSKLLRTMTRITAISFVILLSIPISEKVSGLIESTYSESIDSTIEMASEEIELTTDEDGGLTAVFSKIKDGVTNTAERFKNVLNNFIEAIAVLIVTDCVIPIAVLAFCLWIIKYMSGTLVDVRTVDGDVLKTE